jgi:hypothetical protein
MGWTDDLLDTIGARLARHITIPASLPPRSAAALAPYAEELRPGDVLLVDGGQTRVAAAIKYLTQSTWSHAALCISRTEGGEPELVEAEVGTGIIRSPLRKYAGFHLRICRPIGLNDTALANLTGFALSRIGGAYDLRNVIDLARWLIPTPPVPQRFRRRMIALGSGEPTRAICASLIAEGFNRIGYPILPSVEYLGGAGTAEAREVLHVRHHSLYTPRDFDVSPYFAVIKPTLVRGFDYRQLHWAAGEGPPDAAVMNEA